MSYCRFSSDNWGSDVYAYESGDGVAVHVAASKYVGDVPRVTFPVSTYKKDMDIFLAARKKQMAFYQMHRVKLSNCPMPGKVFMTSPTVKPQKKCAS